MVNSKSNYLQKGLSSITFSVAVIVGGLIALGSMQYQSYSVKNEAGKAVGTQISTVVSALSNYIKTNNALIISGSNVPGLANSGYIPSVSDLQTLGFLNSGFNRQPTRGDSYNIDISITPSGCSSQCSVVGTVWLSNPILQDGTKTDITFLSAAQKASTSANIGFSMPTTASIISGPGWTLPNPDNQKRPGILLGETGLAITSVSSTPIFWQDPVSTRSDLFVLPSQPPYGAVRMVKDEGVPYWYSPDNGWIKYTTSWQVPAADYSFSGNNWPNTSSFSGGNPGDVTYSVADKAIYSYRGTTNNISSWGMIFTDSSNISLGNITKNPSTLTSGGFVRNSIIGYGAGRYLSGSLNTFLGSDVAGLLSSGDNNTAVGVNAAGNLSTANGMSCFGSNACPSTTGTYSSSLGYASSPGSGNNNLSLGAYAYLPDGVSYATVIGSGASWAGQPSYSVRIGSTNTTSIGGAVAWSQISDARLKQNIHDSNIGLDFVRKLKSVEYQLIDAPTVNQIGFIAQDVEKADPNFPGVKKPTDTKGFYSISYTDFVPPLVNSIKELDLRISKNEKSSDDVFLWKFVCCFLMVVCAILTFFVYSLTRRVARIERA